MSECDEMRHQLEQHHHNRDFADVEAKYRQQVVELYGPLSFQGLEQDISLQDISLEDVFIKLTFTVERMVRRRGEPLSKEAVGRRFRFYGRRREVERRHQAEREEREIETIERVQEPISLGRALAQHPSLLISGEPGAGKTTLLRWLAVTCARSLQGEPDRLGPEFGESRLPILVELGRFAQRFMEDEARIAPPDLEAIIVEVLQVEFPDLPAEFLADALAQGRCLVLCDGFDEIADPDARRRAVRSLQSFARRHSPADNRFVIGSRPYGHREVQTGFPCCTIQPFTPEDVQRCIQHWYDLDTALTPQERRKAARTLFDKIQAEPRILELAQTPLLGTIIFLVYRNHGDLPQRRMELNEHCVRILLERWEEDKDIAESGVIGGASWRTQLRLLEPVAYHIHSVEQRTAARGEELLPVLAEALVQEKLCDAEEANREAEQFLAALGRRSALFQHLGGDAYAFPHLTFQEYLAARHIAAQPCPDYIDMLMPHLHKPWWREVHLLTIAHLGSGRSQEETEKASALLEVILDRYKPPFRFLRAFPSRGELFPLSLCRRGLLRVFLYPGKLLAGLRNFPVRAFPRWQLVRRLAWVMRRERLFAVTALGDCAPLGVTNEARERVRRALEDTLLLATANASLLGAPLLATAASSLVRLGKMSPGLIAALVAALCSSQRSVQEAAASSLVQLGQTSPEAIASLVNALIHDSDCGVRSVAARSLGRLAQASSEVTAALVAALGDSDVFVRCMAAFSLGELGQTSPEVIAALLATLDDSDVLVQSAAASGLGQLGQAAPEVIATLIAALGNSDLLVHKAAARSLSQLGQVSPEAIAALVAALGDSRSWMRRASASSLGHLDQAGPEVIAALVATLDDSDKLVQSAVASSLVQLGQTNPEAIAVLLDDLSDSSMDVRRAAVYSLGKLEQASSEMIAALVATLGDSENLVRLAAMSSLVQLGQTNLEVITAVASALGNGNGNVREAGARSLGRLGQASPEVIAALMTAFGDSESRVQQAAASSLVQLGQSDPEVSAALFAALGDGDEHVRLEAVSSLVQLGQASQEVLVALNRALHDSSPYVRYVVHELLPQLLDGKPIPGEEWVPLKVRWERGGRRKRRMRRVALVLLALAMALAPLACVLAALYVPQVRDNQWFLSILLAGIAAWIAFLANVGKIRQTLGDLWQ